MVRWYISYSPTSMRWTLWRKLDLEMMWTRRYSVTTTQWCVFLTTQCKEQAGQRQHILRGRKQAKPSVSNTRNSKMCKGESHWKWYQRHVLKRRVTFLSKSPVGKSQGYGLKHYIAIRGCPSLTPVPTSVSPLCKQRLCELHIPCNVPNISCVSYIFAEDLSLTFRAHPKVLLWYLPYMPPQAHSLLRCSYRCWQSWTHPLLDQDQIPFPRSDR